MGYWKYSALIATAIIAETVNVLIELILGFLIIILSAKSNLFITLICSYDF